MRAIYIILDSLGVGGAPDAARYGDVGANTLGHIAEACADGRGDKEGLRAGPLEIPNLVRLGLGAALQVASGMRLAGSEDGAPIEGLYGSAEEVSLGKDTPSGHFEMTGVPVMFEWMFFPREVPAIPDWIMRPLIEKFQLPGILGNCHASGTQIIADLGAEHIATGKPIVYTSADSVIQIAAHEEHFGLQRLCEICEGVRAFDGLDNLGRIIARPFVGNGKSAPFKRTFNRRDFAKPAPGPTLLDAAVEKGMAVTAIGKVRDIFAGRGVTDLLKAGPNTEIFDRLLEALRTRGDDGIIFANFVEFDSEYGHRRDVPGYAAALEAFDRRVPELEAALSPGDLAVFTADHGNDPTWPGSDHTREQVPVVFFGPDVKPGSIGVRKSLADMGQSFASHLGLDPLAHGESAL